MSSSSSVGKKYHYSTPWQPTTDNNDIINLKSCSFPCTVAIGQSRLDKVVHKVSNCRVGQKKLTDRSIVMNRTVPSLIPSCNKGDKLEMQMHAQECN